MKTARGVAALVGLLILVLSPGWSAPLAAVPTGVDSVSVFAPFPVDSTVSRKLAGFEERFFRLLVEFYPVRAGGLGLHSGDARLGPAGFSEQESERLALRAFEAGLSAAADSLTDPEDRFDAALMLYDVRRDLFELNSLRGWARDPGKALRVVTRGIRNLLSRDYAPPARRFRALAERQREIPEFLQKSLPLVDHPPAPLVEQALVQADMLSVLLRDTVPSATRGISDTLLVAALDESRNDALRAIWEYRSRLLTEYLPEGEESVALGREGLTAALRATEGIAESVDSLRTEAERELDRLEARFRETAARIDSTVSPRQVMLRVSEDHPPADEVLAATREAVTEARDFVIQRGFVPFQDLPLPDVRSTPAFSRWTNATLSVPGPFEISGGRAVLYVTLPDSASSAEDRVQHLRFLNRAFLRNLAIHEVYPGHYLQSLFLSRLRRPVRRAVRDRGFDEGWAHYAESLMLEQGYRSDDLAFRLATLQSALRRAGRFRVALGIHTEGWTEAQATAFLEERCYLEPWAALREARRGLFDPMYLVYCLGRLRLESLRAEVERRDGAAFDLKRFHKQLLELGAPPLPLARAVLLGEDPLRALADP